MDPNNKTNDRPRIAVYCSEPYPCACGFPRAQELGADLGGADAARPRMLGETNPEHRQADPFGAHSPYGQRVRDDLRAMLFGRGPFQGNVPVTGGAGPYYAPPSFVRSSYPFPPPPRGPLQTASSAISGGAEPTLEERRELAAADADTKAWIAVRLAERSRGSRVDPSDIERMASEYDAFAAALRGIAEKRRREGAPSPYTIEEVAEEGGDR